MTSQRQRRRAAREARSRSLIQRLGFVWWIPLVALTAPVAFAIYRAFAGDDGAAEEFARALLWPGVAIYVIAVGIIWAGWALDLEE